MMVDKSSSLFINTRLSEALTKTESSVTKLAAAKRLVSASVDPAALSMSMTLEALSREVAQQSRNSQDEISLMQVADGALQTLNDSIGRIRELSVQAANGTLTDSDRESIQGEISQLRTGIDQIANNTEYNTMKLLDGSFKATLQSGDEFSIRSMTSDALGLDKIDVTTQAGASSALAISDSASDSVTSQRSTIGANVNGIISQISSLNNEWLNTLGSLSRISDLDMASEMVNLTTSQIQTRLAVKVFQVNDSQRTRVLELLS